MFLFCRFGLFWPFSMFYNTYFSKFGRVCKQNPRLLLLKHVPTVLKIESFGALLKYDILNTCINTFNYNIYNIVDTGWSKALEHWRLKQLTSRFSKKIKKITVNTDQVMFSGEICYYWPLIQLTKSLGKHRFSLHNAVAVMYSRNIPMAEKTNCLFSKQKSETM